MAEKTKTIPRIGRWKLLGMLPALLRNPLKTFSSISAKHGGLVEMYFSKSQHLFLVADPLMIEHILKTGVDNYHRPPAIRPLKPFLGDGLFMSEGELWREQYGIMSPAFRAKNFERYYQVFDEELEAFIKRWRDELGRRVDIEKEFYRLMLRLLVKTQFHSKAKIPSDKIITAVHTILKEVSMEEQKMRYVRNRFRKLFGIKGRHREDTISSIEYLENYLDEIFELSQSDPEHRGFILELLEQAETSKGQKRDELMNFLFAGFDTTAVGLTWSVYTILKHGFAERVSEESKKEGRRGDHVFLKKCIRESMRLHPPVWSFHRVSDNEEIVEGYKLPSRAYVMICTHALHRSPKYWNEPLKFNPERFNEAEKLIKENKYIPFGNGRRVCIGQHLAMAEMGWILAELFKNFDFKLLTTAPKLKPGIVIKLRKPIWVETKKDGD